MKALYRKYRPLQLSEVIGQDKTIQQLQGALSQDKISHAYLFIGPRGCGKTSVARIFAHEINHFNYQLEDSYIDIVEIDAATFTGVDNIRELREKAMIVPSIGKYKVYIIDEVHMLSTSAFNALLKILEEPPEHVVFIMATTNPEKVPATITSRTQIYHFSLADPSTMQSFLREISDKEKIKISDDALRIISERGGGSFRDSLSILDQISTINTTDQTIEDNDVAAALGIPEQQEITKLLSAFEGNSTQEITNTLSKLFNYGITAESITRELIQQILKKPTPATLSLVNQLFTVTGNFPEAKLTVALICSSPPPPVSGSATLVKAPSISTPALPSSNPNSKNTVNSFSPQSNNNQTISTPSTASPFSELRKQLVKNAKNHKAENTAPIPDSEDLIEETSPPTLPEAAVSSSGEFNFKGFVANVTNINQSLLIALKKSSFLIDGKDFTIYPEKPVYWRVLAQKNNLEILRSAISSMNLNVKNPDDGIIPRSAISFEEAELGQTSKLSLPSKNLASLSAIMGDIQEVTDNPF